MSIRQVKTRPTISDVAKLAGVSISTVSRVVNETAPVSGDVAERVRSAIDMLDYTPHAAARSLAVKKTNTIGLLLPELSSSFFPPMLRGIETAIRRTNYDLLVYASWYLPQHNGTRRRQPIGEHNADGMLVFVNTLDAEEIRHYYRRDFPLVLLYCTAPSTMMIPSIMFDNESGMNSIVEHLVKVHDRRQIAFLQGTDGNQDSDQREVAFRAALARLGIAHDPRLISRGGFTEAGGEQAVTDLLSRGVHFDAIFTGDDESATGALMALRRAGLRIPQDVAVVGFDDVPIARHLNPPLTTVRVPIEQTGYIAATRLIQLLETGETEANSVLPVDLVIRQSCGCP
jgi:LacI family transcriptional regulator